MAPETFFTGLPFGFKSEPDFTQHVRNYIDEIAKDSTKASDIRNQQSDPKARETLSDIQIVHAKEIAVLEERLQNPEAFYRYVLSIYLRIAEMEQSGKSRVEIVNEFLDTDQESIYNIRGLLNNGIKQEWGYRFTQSFLSKRIDRLIAASKKPNSINQESI